MQELIFQTITSGEHVQDVTFVSFSAKLNGLVLRRIIQTCSNAQLQLSKKYSKMQEYRGNADFKSSGMKGRQYTWSEGETLTELLERKEEIMKNHEIRLKRAASKRENLPLVDVLADALDDEDETTPCTVCHL